MKRQLFRVVLMLLVASVTHAQEAKPAVTSAPAMGNLVIVGGAMRDPVILRRFIELASGADAPIVVIPTAGADDKYDSTWSGLQQFRDAGAKNLTVMHTRDRKVADSEEFVAPLKKAMGVFFPGGRQTRLADAYLDTRMHRELEALLARGGVIGGSSAGASIQASFLVRGDTRGNEIMEGEFTRGFGFLRNSAIDQHILKRNRQFDLIPIIAKFPELLGIGIDEDTAIVVTGDKFEVIGQSYVAIHDRGKVVPPSGAFYLLAPGDQFDLRTRQALRPGPQGARPLERVQSQAPSQRQP